MSFSVTAFYPAERSAAIVTVPMAATSMVLAAAVVACALYVKMVRQVSRSLPNPAFERDSPRSGRAPQFYVRVNRSSAATVYLLCISVEIDRTIMIIPRRQFLKAVIALYTSALYSPPVHSCMAGGSETTYPVPLPPSDYVTGSVDESTIEKFLDKKYGPNSWSYSSSQISLKAPEIAENPSVISVGIHTDDHSLAGRYRSIEVFVQRIVYVSNSKTSMISRVAEFKLGEQIIPDISMRLQNLDSTEIKLIAIFSPVDRSHRVEVVKREKAIKFQICDFIRPNYEDGRWRKRL
jgi:predicted secreted protein